MQLYVIFIYLVLSLILKLQCEKSIAANNPSEIISSNSVLNYNLRNDSVLTPSVDTLKLSNYFDMDIVPASYNTDAYISLLRNKKVALCVNQTSTIGQVHLVDSMKNTGVNIVKIFAPEHGFRGKGDAGEHIQNEVDVKTGIPIISLYGNNKKPSVVDMNNIDVMIFDIQDVGVRFYTFISTLHYIMEACAENNVELIVLDRPNPNGYYIDGPVLMPEFQSFVGMHKVPVVYGLNIAEYANMIKGEAWINESKSLKLTTIPCKNYTHKKFYNLPIAPSPNLRTMLSVYLYPSLCFFEGTPVSVGRGTNKPFEQWGHPDFKKYSYSFKPMPSEGSKDPLLKGETCYGEGYTELALIRIREQKKINIQYLAKAYKLIVNKDKFFNNFFNKLAGNDLLQKQIKTALNENEIRESWQKDIEEYKIIRKNYLMYEDFE